jgi:hypothetical protein
MAGMLHIPGHTAWIGYIAVDHVDAHIEKIVEAGGKLWKPATDVPGMLRFAVMSDPQGAAIVVFTPNHSTQRTSKAGLSSTTSSLVGLRSAIWTWGRWAFIASSTRATTNKWETAA